MRTPRAWFEKARWPHGPECPKCGSINHSAWLKKPRRWNCMGCHHQFFGDDGNANASDASPAAGMGACDLPDRIHVNRGRILQWVHAPCCHRRISLGLGHTSWTLYQRGDIPLNWYASSASERCSASDPVGGVPPPTPDCIIHTSVRKHATRPGCQVRHERQIWCS